MSYATPLEAGQRLPRRAPPLTAIYNKEISEWCTFMEFSGFKADSLSFTALVNRPF